MEWKDIHGWEGLYEISSEGSVRNKLSGHVLVGDKNSSGYRRVCLYGKEHIPHKQRFFIHRLVAEHFMPNPLNLIEVNHIDCDKTNNRIENLEWIDRANNELHAKMNGKKVYKPFIVTYRDRGDVTYHTIGELDRELSVSNRCVANWLQNLFNGYKKFEITNMKYLTDLKA